MGSLEAEVLKFLWSQDHAATPGEVLEGLGSGLAYTTVMTILTRLWSKQLVFRDRDGRAYAYRPALSEAEFAARTKTSDSAVYSSEYGRSIYGGESRAKSWC